MLRKIIEIDRDACNGCGLCAAACHEGAIAMVDGKAALLRDDYCDGLGDCLPVCPTGAITFTQREAAAYDEAAVRAKAAQQVLDAMPPMGCPGTRARVIQRAAAPLAAPEIHGEAASQLSQWPVQIQLAPVNAPYFHRANLLVAADCTAFAYGGFHGRFIRGRVALIGCPKLDACDYAEKLTAILEANDIKSVTVVRMEVPCCGGIVQAVQTALRQSGKLIPWQVVTISTDGQILED